MGQIKLEMKRDFIKQAFLNFLFVFLSRVIKWTTELY